MLRIIYWPGVYKARHTIQHAALQQGDEYTPIFYFALYTYKLHCLFHAHFDFPLLPRTIPSPFTMETRASCKRSCYDFHRHREILPWHVMIPQLDFPLLSNNNSQHRLLRAHPPPFPCRCCCRCCCRCRLLALALLAPCLPAAGTVVSSLARRCCCCRRCHHGEPWGEPVRPPARPPRGPAAAATTTGVCARPAFSRRGHAACSVGEGGLAEECVEFSLLFCVLSLGVSCVRACFEGREVWKVSI